ncbi:MAG: hypothetical protein AAB649_02450 [Patescibacteria group bacterium]|mgnify:CR=1 FL=1
MNKKIGIIIGVGFAVVVLVGGLFLFLRARNEAKREAMRAAQEQQALLNKQKAEGEALSAEEDELANKRGFAKNAVVQNNETSVTSSASTYEKGGSYEVYAAEKLKKASTGNVVLFFRAITCEPCQALDADIRAHIQDIPKNLTILDVDYETAIVLKQRYNVFNEDTFVQVDTIGTPLKIWTASHTLQALINEVQ